MNITDQQQQCLDYVKNTGGGATLDNFINDWEPIGFTLWNELVAMNLVTIDKQRRIAIKNE